MKEKTEKIKQLLNDFDKENLKDAKNHIYYLLNKIFEQDTDPDLLLFYKIITDNLTKDINKKNLSSFHILKKIDKPLALKVEEIFNRYTDFINEAVGDRGLTRQQSAKSYDTFYMVIKIIIDQVDGVPLSLKTFFNFANNFETHFNQQFPGYAESGLGHVIFLNK